jgi:hypothetical protein
MIKLDKKITQWRVKAEEDTPISNNEVVHELTERPFILRGATRKLKPHNIDNALYVTLNAYMLNQGKDNEYHHPAEVFINTKNMEQYQWITALMRVISAVFRKGGEYKFIINELKETFDPKGGYRVKGGKWRNSLVADIGFAIEELLIELQCIEAPEHIIIPEKVKGISTKRDCSKCGDKECVVILDGCATCTACGDSKCG